MTTQYPRDGRFPRRELSSRAGFRRPEWVVVGVRIDPTGDSQVTHMVVASTELTEAELECTTSWMEDTAMVLERPEFHVRHVYQLHVTMEQSGRAEAAVWMAYGHSYAEALSNLMNSGKWDPDRTRPEIGAQQKEPEYRLAIQKDLAP